MKKVLMFAMLLAGGEAYGAHFNSGDDFAGASKNTDKWGDTIVDGAAVFTQTGGVVKFSNPSAVGEGFVAWPWKVEGPFGSSWSIQADVHMPSITLADGYTAVGVGIGVRNSGDETDFFGLSLEHLRNTGQDQRLVFTNGIDIDGGDAEETSALTTGVLGAVRIFWNAQTQILQAQYDTDGPTNGYQWTTLKNFSPAVSWNMGGGDVFQVIIGGYSEETAVPLSKNVYIDNFKIAEEAAVNLLGSDNFNDNEKDPGKWGEDEGEGDSTLTEINGRLEYTKADTADSWAGRPWIANTGSYVEDWEAFVDVHVGNVAVAEDGHDLRMYLDVGAGSFNAAVQLDLTNEGGSTLRRFRFLEEGPGGGEAIAVTTATDGAVRVAFDAANKVLSFYYDENGGIDGYAWTLLGSVDVDDVGSDWELEDSSRFHLSIDGESEGVVVTSGDAYADNFNGISSFTPLITGSPNGFDEFASDARNDQKWGDHFHDGDAELSQSGDGVLRFTASPGAPPDDEPMEAWLWQANGSFTGSWSIQADLHVPVIPLAPGNTAAGMGIAVLNSADEEDNFAVSLENYSSNAGPQQFHFLSTIDTNGEGEPEVFAPTGSTTGSVRISWNHTTKQLTGAYDADGPLNGYNWTVFRTFNPATGGWNMTSAQSFKFAIYGSSELTEVTLNHDFYADNFYVFGATKTLLPLAKTLAATDIGHDSALLKGQVDPKGAARAVSFEYGLTTSYGLQAVADPASVEGGGLQNVQAQITGELLPHTKYHYRVRAGSALGTAYGANMTFTTDNRKPTAEADDLVVLPGATVALELLSNGDDPDGDPLTLQSFTALQPASAGKLKKSGNTVVFTAAADFTGPATFTYILKDGFGGSSPAATFTLTKGTCTLSQSEMTVPAFAFPYMLTVTANGAWSVVENLSWVNGGQSGSGSGFVTFFVQSNNSKIPRTGTVMIGGQPLTINQEAVEAPSIMPQPGASLNTRVSAFYHLPIVTTGQPVTYTVTNMPPGLTIDSYGAITGMPTKADSYDVVVKAKNAAGNAETAFTIQVASLNAAVIGSFQGLISPDEEINDQVGSRLEMTVASTGIVSGKIITGTTALPFKGSLIATADDADDVSLSIQVPRKNASTLTLQLVFDSVGNVFAGAFGESNAPFPIPSFPVIVTGPDAICWRKTDSPGKYDALHTFSLNNDDADPALPQGFGYGSFKPNAQTGAVLVSGKLPDNTTFTTKTFVGPDGRILIYSPMYGNKGSLSGVLTVHTQDGEPPSANTIDSGLIWFKPEAPNDTAYPNGIGPLELFVPGGAYPGIAPGEVVMNMDDSSPDNNAQLVLSQGQLLTESQEIALDIKIYNPAAGLVNKADVPSNSLNITMPTLNATTGAFAGTFTLPGGTTLRKVSYQGQIIRLGNGDYVGRGFCVVPEPIVSPLTPATAAKQSSRVTLVPITPP